MGIPPESAWLADFAHPHGAPRLEVLARRWAGPRRRDLLDTIADARWLDRTRATPVEIVDSTPAGVERLLRVRGANGRCIVLAEEPSAAYEALREALVRVVGQSYAAIVFCTPGPLAYYETETSERFILIGTARVGEKNVAPEAALKARQPR